MEVKPHGLRKKTSLLFSVSYFFFATSEESSG